MRRRLSTLAMMAAILAAPAASNAAIAGSLFDDAGAVWHMGKAENPAGKRASLEIEGKVKLGVELTGTEREASLRRGGDGRAAVFDGGFLRAAIFPDHPLALRGKEMTLYLRLQDRAGSWSAPLFGKATPDDEYADILYGRDGALRYLWRTEPIEQRAFAFGSGARYGFNGENNDQHSLAAYRPGEFVLSTLTLDETGLVTLFHNGQKSSGKIDIAKENLGDALFRVGAKHDDSEFLDGDIAEILVYDRQITDSERAVVENRLRRKWALGGLNASADGPLPARGLLLHLAADDVSADPACPGKAGPLAAWKDQSGSGRILTQDDPGKRPELVPGGLAGKAVVRFHGGHCLDTRAVLPAGCKQFTFVAVWKRKHAAGSEVVLEQSSPGAGRRACLLTQGRAVGANDFADGILRLCAPAMLIGPKSWHDVIVRFRGPNLELFVDGVLVDEEWPHGELFQFQGPFLIGAGYEKGELKAGFHGKIDHLALWSRALKDEEIMTLAGGAEKVAQRERQINGPVQASPQYWKPRGYNAWAGDCMPFFQDGTFRLFYLFDRHHHQSKWGQGAHQYAQMSTQDLVNWQQQSLAVPIVRQWECSMGTGDCIWHDGVYYMFYTDCGSRCEYKDKPQRGSWIFCATSSDGVHFHKDLKPLVPGLDCTVFRDPATGLFHLIRGGENRLVSKDLRKWEEIPGDFVHRKPGTSAECPDEFEWNGWYYFILGANAIWKSRSALGPWEEMKPTIYDGLFVPKVAGFTGGRRILAGFIFERGWAGHLALRELTQAPDGSLGIKFVPELVPASGTPQHLAFTALDPEASGDAHKLTIKTGARFAAAALDGVAGNVRITLRVVPQPGARCFGLCVRGKGQYAGGCELRLEPSRQRAQYGTPQGQGLAPDSTARIALGRDYAIENVTGLDRPFTLDVIVKNDLVDTCIDGRRTMITRRNPEPHGDRLFFFARQGEVTFESIEVRPLKEPEG